MRADSPGFGFRSEAAKGCRITPPSPARDVGTLGAAYVVRLTRGERSLTTRAIVIR